jgi:Mg/Co/Ni transporter MgtE
MNILSRINYTEPARLRAVWVALVALLATLGVSVSADIDAKVTAIIALLAVVLPMIQGETTRAAVYAPATVDAIESGEITEDEAE